MQFDPRARGLSLATQSRRAAATDASRYHLILALFLFAAIGRCAFVYLTATSRRDAFMLRLYLFILFIGRRAEMLEQSAHNVLDTLLANHCQ